MAIVPTKRLHFATLTTWVGGLLLVAAGILKLVTPPPPLDFLQLPSQVYTTCWVAEIAMGLWLLSGMNRVQALFFGTLTFSVLAIVSGLIAASGVGDCGCLGRLSLNPWIMCGIDSAMSLGLGSSLWLSTARDQFRQSLRRFVATTASIAIVLAIISAVLIGSYGSIEAAVRNWEGHSLYVPRSVNADPPDEEGNALGTIAVRNDGNESIRIIGSDVCCGSRMDTLLPITLEPLESAELLVRVSCHKSPLTITIWAETNGKLKKQRVVVLCRNPE